MKRENRLRNRITQFGYEHRGLERELHKVQRSAAEVRRLLDGMAPAAVKKTENEEIKRK